MSEWMPHTLTKAGRELQAKVEAGTKLVLTRMGLGSGQETIDEVDELLDLVAQETSIAISSAKEVGEMCSVFGILDTATLEHGFNCREMGLFANDPDKGEILYAIMLDGKPDWLPAHLQTSLTLTFRIDIAIANGTEITVIIDPAGLVDVDMLHAHAHTVRRNKQYKKGDIVTSPSLPHGLVLEALADGKTAEVLVDVSSMECGNSKEDGTVVWQAKRVVVTSVDDEEHTIEWLHDQVEMLGTRIYEVVIPPTGWRNNEGSYRYAIDIPVENLAAGMPITVSPFPESVDAAGLCGLCPTAQSLTGAIRILAKAIPAGNVEVSLTAFSAKGGGSGGGGDVPIATESTAGIVKIGEGLKVNPDGTLYVNKEKVMTDEDLVDEEQEKQDIIHDLES